MHCTSRVWTLSFSNMHNIACQQVSGQARRQQGNKSCEGEANQAPSVGHQNNTVRFRHILSTVYSILYPPPGSFWYRVSRGSGVASVPSPYSGCPQCDATDVDSYAGAEPDSVPEHPKEPQSRPVCAAAMATQYETHSQQANKGCSNHQ